MNFQDLLELASGSAEGNDNLDKGSVGYGGYGFVLRDLSLPLSRKLCNFGSMGKFAQDLKRTISSGSMKKFVKCLDSTLLSGQGLLIDDVLGDILLIGSIKTLVPSLELGGDEVLFRVWAFVATVDGRTFPIQLYYGPTRLAVKGWKIGGHTWSFEDGLKIPEELIKITNCDPFTLSLPFKKEFVESLEQALRKVPPSDFYAIYEHDLGYTLMGISDGDPLSIELGEIPSILDVKATIRDFFKIELNPKVFEKWDFPLF